MVASFIASLKTAVMGMLMGTFVAPEAGMVVLTTGAAWGEAANANIEKNAINRRLPEKLRAFMIQPSILWFLRIKPVAAYLRERF
jgi:hypothetical protein